MRYVKIFLLFMLINAGFSCKKAVTNKLEKYFSENLLNRDFVITYANDEGDLITAQYTGYTFVLKKGADNFGGPLVVTKGADQFTGTWKSNDDYGKLTIVLPPARPEFAFLTRDWRFKSKSLTVLKFAPWGSDAQIDLTMERR